MAFWTSSYGAKQGGRMTQNEGRVVASIEYSATTLPVVFVVVGPRANAITEVLRPELQDMYLCAWRDAVAAVMDDCGWTYEAPQTAHIAGSNGFAADGLVSFGAARSNCA